MTEDTGILYRVVSTFVLFLCAVAGWLVYVRWKNDKKGLPPGPVGVPFLGYMPFLSKKLHEDFARLGKRYGDIIYLEIGNKEVVVLNSIDAVNEAFNKQADVFEGRGDSYVLKKLWNKSGQPNDAVGKGILMSEGSKWDSLRRFAVDHISFDQALDATRLEVVEMVSVLKMEKHTSHDVRQFLMPAISNIIIKTALGFRKPYHDELYQEYIQNFMLVGDLMHQTSAIDLVPLIEKLPPFSARMSSLKQAFKIKLSLISKMITESPPSENEPSFLSDFRKNGLGIGEESGVAGTYTNEELTMVMNDLFGASTEAMTSTMQWAIFYMILHPNVQRKVQEEIDARFGSPEKSLISWDDKGTLSYTLATMKEIQRCASVAPLGVFRRNTRSTQLKDLAIPEGCIVMANLWNILHNEQVWHDPSSFSPERFTDNVKTPSFVPFSLGTRGCPFTEIAAAELFVIFANLLHRFEFQAASDSRLPAETDYVAALTRRPKDFSFAVRKRQQKLLPDHLEAA